jgi:iron complex outermembrane recepter protein
MNYYYYPLGKHSLPFYRLLALIGCWLCLFVGVARAQGPISGTITDDDTGQPLVGARVSLLGQKAGGMTDVEGNFRFRSPVPPPFTLEITYLGYDTVRQEVETLQKKVAIALAPGSVNLSEVEIVSSALVERQRQEPLSVESMSINAIKETPSVNFYDGLGALKGVDLMSASIGFKVINTRGFNSSAPVRSLQVIDGIDNQAPGLNFSLGNFLGASELDVEQVDLIVGASSAYYGPNAFNGVISMKTKSPFVHQGLSALGRVGERNLAEIGLRYAKVFKNRQGEEHLAFKINAYYLRVDDWEADNLAEVDQADSLRVGVDNPGGYDAVNRYGDENINPGPRTYDDLQGLIDYPGLGTIHRSGFEEVDLVDYDTRNLKLAGALHWRIRPKVEAIVSTNFATGTTVLQGENRFSLRDIRFLQNRLEIRQEDRFFFRVYRTQENAGNSYDAVRTAFVLQNSFLNETDWTVQYRRAWRQNIVPRIREIESFPQLELLLDDNGNVVVDPETGQVTLIFDEEQARSILADYSDSLAIWHQQVRAQVEQNIPQPGSARFDSVLSDITSRSILDRGGTRIIDRSSLYHAHGEYTWTPSWAKIVLGANGRLYTPISEGTLFDDRPRITPIDTLENQQIIYDTTEVRITNWEAGAYLGIEKRFIDDRLKFNATLRIDKNQNFSFLASPAVSGVFLLNETDVLRMSFSSAIRNPTLSDQYLNFNAGPAILLGNLDGFDSLVTTESFQAFSQNGLDRSRLEYFDLDPIQPEQVRTAEIGYRAMWFKRLYVDAGYYFSFYRNFIGYQVGILTQFAPGLAIPTTIQPYRLAANAADRVTTQGVAIGLNYYFNSGLTLNGNYSWNILNTQTDDPIIPAFNTPEHKFNLGVSGRDMNLGPVHHLGFSVNYKWVEGFLFEGSPQFTGFVPTYDLLDAQVNRYFPKLKTTFKLGASNLLDNRAFQIYGGPKIGRLFYFSFQTELNQM